MRRNVGTLQTLFTADWQWIVVAQLIAVAGTLILLKVVANVASSGDFGRFGLVLAVAGGVNSLAFGPVIAWANRYYQEGHEAGRLPAYFRALAAAAAIAITATSSLVFIAIAVAPNVIARLGIAPQLVLLGLLAGILQSANEVLVAVSNAALRRRPAALSLIGSRWLPVVLVLASYGLGFRSVEAYAAAVSIALITVLAIQIGQLVLIESFERTQRTPARAGDSYLRTLITYALPYVLWGIPSYVITFGDRYALAYFTNPTTVGAYIAMTTATISAVNILGAAVNRVLEPAVYATVGSGIIRERVDRAHRMIDSSILIMVVVLVPIVAAYAIVPREVIALFTAAPYSTHADILWALMLAGVLFLVGQELYLHGNVEKRMWPYLPVRLLHAAVFVIGVVLLLPQAGLLGLVIALLVSYFAQILFVLATNRLVVRQT